ncbi:MAG: CHASE2 domain-containing protein [Bacteriovoracaceae bacterium]
MISKIIQYLGILLIIGFSAASTFFAIAEREIIDPSIKKKIRYATFFEDRFYDYRMLRTLDRKAYDDRIVLAAIDDESLKPENIGRWPWDRSVWGQILKKVKHFGGKIIAFDVFFSEPQKFCDQDFDSVFAEAITDFQSKPGNYIILPFKVDDYNDDAFAELPENLYNFIMDSQLPQGSDLLSTYISKTAYPIQKLLDREPGMGHIQAQEDPDGIFRHYHIVANSETLYFPSFGLLTYMLYADERPQITMNQKGQWVVETKGGKLPLNFRGESKIKWFGNAENFPTVSLWDIYNADVDDPKFHSTLKDKIIFIGSTAYGAHDFRHTPMDSQMPGIYFHMNMTHMLLEGDFYRPEEDSTFMSWTLLAGGSLIMILLMLLNNPLIDIVGMILLTGGMYVADTYFLIPQGYQNKLFFCIFSVVSIYSWSTFLHFYLTSKEKKRIKGTFSSFVSPAVVDEMLANPDLVKVGGEKKNITVFFSDVRDFTSISEKLSPEELATCLNQYMGVMTDIIFETYGTLDKYIGDAIVAFWGAPLKVENHAYQAVKAAIKMIEVLPGINDKFREQGFPEFKHGIGLNTGDCSVGNMGSDSIFQYTALGDNMNLGARLESLCKYYGVQLNISEATLLAIPEELRSEFRYRILDKVRVKGKEDAVTIYEVYHKFHDFYKDQSAHNDYMKAFDHYLAQEFQEAVDLLTPLVQAYPNDKSCKRIKEFSENFIQNPPPADWDGVYTHTTKG